METYGGQFADNVMVTVIMTKSFDRPFSKGRGFLRQRLKSPSAEGEIPLFVQKAARTPRIPFY